MMNTLTDKIFFVSFIPTGGTAGSKGDIFLGLSSLQSSEAVGNFQKRAPLIFPVEVPKGHCSSGLLQHYIFLDAETEAQKGRMTYPRPGNYLDRKAVRDSENPPRKRKRHT